MLNLIIALWPAVVSLLALFIHRKQNSNQAWTGGPISWPKSFWLAFTILTWFFLPIFIWLHPDFPAGARALFAFHLGSWWIRGLLELVMIYKWKNWSPRYGIAHDLIHIAGAIGICIVTGTSFDGHISWLVSSMALMFIYTAAFEAFFAWRFLILRTRAQADENIYFADDSPQWRLVNRVSLIAVLISLTHLTVNGWFLLS